MRVRFGIRRLGLALLGGGSLALQSVESRLSAQSSPPPLASAAVTMPSTALDLLPDSGLASPQLRPNEKPLPINLATALGIANVQPWDIQAASDRTRIASAQLLQSSVLWVPTMYTGAVYDIHAGATQGSSGAVSTTPTTGSWEFGATPQFVFACTEAIFEPLAARRLLQARRAELQAATNDTTNAVARAYFNVQEARGDLAAASEVLHRSEELIRKIKVMSPEITPQVEVARAEAQYFRFRQSERSARERWNVASAELARVLRLDPTAVLMPLEPPHLQITLVSHEQSLDTLLPVALYARPELTASKELAEAALKRWREEQFRPLLPLVFARGNSTQTPDPLAIGVFGGGSDGTMGNFRTRFDYQVQVLWELKNMGFGNAALMRQRQTEYDISRIQIYRMQDVVAKEVVEAFAQMQSAHDRVELAREGLRQAASSANDNYKALGEVRRVGGQIVNLVIRPFEAIAAEQALLQAYTDYFGAVADYNRSQFQLYRALGNPAQALTLLDQLLSGAKSQANPAPAVPANSGAIVAASAELVPASLQIRLPADAELYCDTTKLNLTGVDRRFVSPPLPQGKAFTYTIRARWTTPDGRQNDLVRNVQVEAGKESRLDFLETQGK